MTSKIKTDTSKLKSDSESVDQIVKSLKREVKSLQHDIQVMNQMWSGETSEQYKKVVLNDINDLETIVNGIANIRNYEETCQENYDKCEESIANIIREIKV